MKTALLIATAAVVAVCGSAVSARSGLATKYGRMSLFGGYSEKQVEPGVWRVSGHSNGPAGRGFGQSMAAYRAAEILSAQGFTYVQILDAKGREESVGLSRSSMNFSGEHMTLTVRGAYSPEAPADCRTKVPRSCFTVATSTVMTRLRPMLHIGE